MISCDTNGKWTYANEISDIVTTVRIDEKWARDARQCPTLDLVQQTSRNNGVYRNLRQDCVLRCPAKPKGSNCYLKKVSSYCLLSSKVHQHVAGQKKLTKISGYYFYNSSWNTEYKLWEIMSSVEPLKRQNIFVNPWRRKGFWIWNHLKCLS